MENFLRYATGRGVLKRGERVILLIDDKNLTHLPVAHTCYLTVNCSMITDIAEIKKRWQIVIDHREESGFGIR